MVVNQVNPKCGLRVECVENRHENSHRGCDNDIVKGN